ncbi:unnamed protein product [Ilex paraguariensis]|uniref:Uncharacterized protein n=1 Tax=Ilex paraguariensis TaxID=185542 RepID=A0ABC8UG52_9AQUA
MLLASSTSLSMAKAVVTIKSKSCSRRPTILPRMDNFSPSSNFLTLAISVATYWSAKRANSVNLATYSITDIVPCLRSRNSRAFACLAVAGKYFPMKSSWNSTHVMASKFLESFTQSHHTWDSPSNWNVARVILVASEVISIALKILSTCRNQ